LDLAALRLRPGCDRRLRGGHLWVYSNEVDIAHSPLKDFSPGDPVLLEDSRGKPLAIAYVNPNTLICARILSRNYRQQADRQLIRQRVESALQLRQSLYPQPFYRLIYGDSDGLPGLVVDRYGTVLVLQVNTAGMERMLDDIIAVLQATVKPAAIVLRNDAAMRKLEGLDSYVRLAAGELEEPVLITENDTEFAVPVLDGQKTGWFYDHRLNRYATQRLARGARVLDVCSYIGGWGVQAAVAGAREVLMLDSSASALQLALENAERNGCGASCAVHEGNAQQAMRELYQEGRRFDLVVLDPPAFIKRRKDVRQGLQGYHRINELAMRLVEPGGYLVSASCSMHLTEESLMDVVRASGRQSQRDVRIIGRGYQGPDHPVHPAIAETAYLKTLFCQLTAG
jgi:23S rRNA (cytosine1962-C5)-methyltransferase